jgi:sulfate adenylyltransferase subunit 2
MYSPTLHALESEAIHIIREAFVTARNPVLLYSIGKDSSVLTHLAYKAFYPGPIPFRLLHVDTGWKFQAMYKFKQEIAEHYQVDILTWQNPQHKLSPLEHDSDIYTRVMKTDALKQALDHYGFDVAFGGARRDEEMSRAKERVFSFRDKYHQWDPRNQRPELWRLYNTYTHRNESMRVFPLSNWTELNVWQYIQQEQIPVMPLYFAAERPIVERKGMLIMADDDRLDLEGVVPKQEMVRFRTLGCYPLTAAIHSDATTVNAIIQELLLTRNSERNGRLIDSGSSMESKKKEGYF